METRRQPTRPLVQAGIESALGGLARLLGSSRVWTALLHDSVAFPIHGPIPLLSSNFLPMCLWIPYHPQIWPKAQRWLRSFAPIIIIIIIIINK